jgi:hypothetical protein
VDLLSSPAPGEQCVAKPILGQILQQAVSDYWQLLP